VDIVSGTVVARFRAGRGCGLDAIFAFLGRLALGSVLAIIVGYAFTFASAIYPIPPRDAYVWNDSLRRMWQPPERITLTSGAQKVGYLLGVKDDWQILLTKKGRAIEYLRPKDVTSRTVCDLGSAPRRSPFWGSTDLAPTRYPLCFPAMGGQGAPASPNGAPAQVHMPAPVPTSSSQFKSRPY